MTNRWTAAGAALSAVAGLMGAGAYWLLRRPLARTKGALHLPGLARPVEILRDGWGIPHIYAETLPDLMYAQGFVHAQDRLWQMDLQRRLVAGRLSEILGERSLPVDRWMRTLTMRRVAEQEVALHDGEARACLDAYANGVTARIQQGRLPVEFTLLRYRPEPWIAADSLAWAKMMSWSLSVNWETEILRARLIERLGPQWAAELEPPLADSVVHIVGSVADLVTLGASDGPETSAGALERAEAARVFTGPAAHQGLGSNSWVVAGARTTTGAPLLANDMHLSMNLPSIWYENHLVGAGLDVTGVTFPGIPGVVAGHNGRVAWGFTAGLTDVQDLCQERLRRRVDDTGRDRVQYEMQGEWRDAQVLREEILVKGGEPIYEEVIVTHHGPIVNALVVDIAGEESWGGAGRQPLALRWTSLEPRAPFRGLFAMNSARDCLEFREALRHWAGPVQNVVYADVEGNIAYTLAGPVPIRAKGDGRLPVPGWTGEYEWIGAIPFEEMPHLYNPPQGYIASANNPIVGDGYAYYLGSEFALGCRAQRIEELISLPDKLDMAYCQRMQFDLVSPFARTITGYLGQLHVDDPELALVVERLWGWDGELAADSPAAALFQVFVRGAIRRTLEGKLGNLTERYAGKGPTPLLAERSLFGGRACEWLQVVMAEPGSPWFDLGEGQTRDDVIRLALREAVDFLKSELGPNIDDWAWGRLHTLTYAHTLGAVKPLDRLFNRGPFPLGGDGSTLWATGANLHDLNSDLIVGPPFRFIVDLGDLRKSVGLLAPGQSGQPGSRHYDDQVEAWFTGEYHPMLYTRDDVEEGAVARLHLVPS